MVDYPELHMLFDGKDALSVNEQTMLDAAVQEGLDSATKQKANISALGSEVRRCVESLLFCPKSLESHPIAKATLTTMLNARRSNLEQVWYRVKVDKYPAGTAYLE